MKVEPYLFFPGNCEKALNFYEKTLGAKIQHIMRYKETPPDVRKSMPPTAARWGVKIMHASFLVGDTQVMASDNPDAANECACGPDGCNCFSLCLSTKDAEEAKRVFGALARGGKITMPLAPAFWGSPAFGMLRDKFGVNWMIIAAQ